MTRKPYRRSSMFRRSPTVLSGGHDFTMPEPPRRPTRTLEEAFGPFPRLGRHEKRGRHELPPLAGVISGGPMTDAQRLAVKTLWLERYAEARARERAHPLIRAGRIG